MSHTGGRAPGVRVARQKASGDPVTRQGLVNFARVVVVLLTGVSLFHAWVGAYEAAHTGIRVLKRSSVSWRELDQFEYVRDELGREVPPGTRMAILTSDGLWDQRLGEFAAINHIVLVSNVSQAEVSAVVVSDASAAQGVRLVVERVR
jgi:hypothetical protein